MFLELPADIYAWLISIDVLDDSTYDTEAAKSNKDLFPNYPNLPASVANFSFNENGTVSLNKKLTKSIFTGEFFVSVFSKMNLLMNSLYGNIYKNDETLNNVINDDNPKIKLKNWELILESIKNYYGIIFDSDFKTLLIAGDIKTFNELFQRLYTFYNELQARIDKENETKNLDKKPNIELPVFDNDKTRELPKVRFNEDIVDLEELSENIVEAKPLTQTRSVLEFILLSICKSMSLTPKQAAGLLADDKKYLSHIIIHGISSSKNFGPVKEFYQMILGNIDYFIQLIQINSVAYPNQISKNIELSLSSMKPGLLSKNIDIVYISGRLLSKLALELIEINLISSAFDWFVMPNGGLEASILCLKRFDCATEIVVTMINSFAKFHLYELFAVYLKNFLTSDGAYLNFLSDIIGVFSRLSNFNEEFTKNNLKQFFIETALETSRSPNINERIQCAYFLGELWCNFSMYIDSEMENYQILSIFKTLYKDPNHIVQITALGQLFRVMYSFSGERNTFVAVIYKALIFTFVEFHSNIKIRDFIISNFDYAFKVILSIPIGILVEPYVKQIQLCLGGTYLFNMNDINFLITIARHPRFNVKEATLAMDVLGKIYFSLGSDEINIFENDQVEAMRTNTYRGIYFYKVVDDTFTMILSRYLMHDLGVEFCFKFIKMILLTFCKLDKTLSDKIYLNAIALNVNPEDNKMKLVFEEDVVLNRKEKDHTINFRSLTKMIIVQMVCDILEINNTFMNNIIKTLVICAALRHYEIYSFYNIGLSKMLEHFGKANDLVYYYNVNKDELDVDGDFEKQICQIYNKLPEYQAITEEEKNPETLSTVDVANLNKTNSTSKTGLTAKGTKQKRIFLKEKSMSIEPKYVNRLSSLKKTNIARKVNKVREDNGNDHDRFIDYNEKAKVSLLKHSKNIVTKVTDNNIKLLNLNDEEDRDIIKLKIFLKDYSPFFKEVFAKYCGSIYHPTQGKKFNSVKDIGDTISPSEIIKMFQDHNVLNRIITKDEITLILMLMSTKVFGKPNLKAGVSFNEFIEDFIQIAYFSFCRPPFVYRNYTISDYAEEMIKLFSREFPNNKKYKNQKTLINKNEKFICDAVNEKLKYNTMTAIPKGFNKYLDTEINYKYYVPDCMYWVIGESNKVCLEILDEIIAKALGEHIHTLEGFAKVSENYKIKPAFPGKLTGEQLGRLEFEDQKLKVLKKRNENKRYQSKLKGEENKSFSQPKGKNIKDLLLFRGKEKDLK